MRTWIVVRMISDNRYFVVDVFRIVFKAKIIFSESYDEVFFLISEKQIGTQYKRITSHAISIEIDGIRKVGKKWRKIISQKSTSFFEIIEIVKYIRY